MLLLSLSPQSILPELSLLSVNLSPVMLSLLLLMLLPLSTLFSLLSLCNLFCCRQRDIGSNNGNPPTAGNDFPNNDKSLLSAPLTFEVVLFEVVLLPEGSETVFDVNGGRALIS